RIALLVKELQHLADHAVLQTKDARDPVADLQHGPDADLLDLVLERAELLLEDGGDLFRFDCHYVRSLFDRAVTFDGSEFACCYRSRPVGRANHLIVYEVSSPSSV